MATRGPWAHDADPASLTKPRGGSSCWPGSRSGAARSLDGFRVQRRGLPLLSRSHAIDLVGEKHLRCRSTERGPTQEQPYSQGHPDGEEGQPACRRGKRAGVCRVEEEQPLVARSGQAPEPSSDREHEATGPTAGIAPSLNGEQQGEDDPVHIAR